MYLLFTLSKDFQWAGLQSLLGQIWPASLIFTLLLLVAIYSFKSNLHKGLTSPWNLLSLGGKTHLFYLI